MALEAQLVQVISHLSGLLKSDKTLRLWLNARRRDNQMNLLKYSPEPAD